MNEFDPRFMKDEELQNLLERWNVPGAPQSLDNRVIAGYNNLMGDASARRDSAPNEVVNMKFCNTCQEEFADRFSFCPVDGTPLSIEPVKSATVPAREIESSYPISETEPVKSTTAPTYFEAPATPPKTPREVTTCPSLAPVPRIWFAFSISCCKTGKTRPSSIQPGSACSVSPMEAIPVWH